MMITVSSNLPESATSLFRQAFSFRAHKTIKTLLITSAALHAAEFIASTIFFSRFSTPFFVTPVAALLNGEESFLYAHSIVRQYGFFVVQLSLLAIFIATNPAAYQPLIRVLAATRLAMAGLGIYAFSKDAISLVQFLPAFVADIGLGVALLRFAPTERLSYSAAAELAQLSEKTILGIQLNAATQRTALQVLCATAGGLWMLWGLGSTVFWEIGVANISSDGMAEMNLLNAMQANFIVRNQQGIMLFGVGAATALGAYFPLSHLRIIEFVIIQQVINALSAGVELLFGSILLPQFFTVFSVQAATFLLFYALYPSHKCEVGATLNQEK